MNQDKFLAPDGVLPEWSKKDYREWVFWERDFLRDSGWHGYDPPTIGWLRLE